jgi:putative transposase
MAMSVTECHEPTMGWAEAWGVRARAAAAPAVQLGLHEARRHGRGGHREGAGRKKGARPRTPHRARPVLSRHVPVHVTLRAARGVPSFRHERMARTIGRAIRAMRVAREDFRIVELSIQTNHVHLIVEAEGARALSSAIRSLEARVSKALNRHVLRRRRGRIWGDRYHRVDLKTPTQARHALAYVLQNGHHHGVVRAGEKDPLSSAPWSSRYVTRAELPPETAPTSPARTFMLNVLWERRWPGAISPSEIPG